MIHRLLPSRLVRPTEMAGDSETRLVRASRAAEKRPFSGKYSCRLGLGRIREPGREDKQKRTGQRNVRPRGFVRFL
jgi:hypothetical protein